MPFTVWEGGSGDMETFRLLDCGEVYVNPPEELIVLGYVGFLEEDIVIMVGKQSGRVYKDEDEIVYSVADTSSFTRTLPLHVTSLAERALVPRDGIHGYYDIATKTASANQRG
ncbi:Hypp3587 [Branchiostoma lanceolatum]|uniref:Hypp3587 protein n=1 Tax=Branchiostoma lanceolatum TaxID=7740 RepID=A0A8K0A3G2_BRALA|nr:Hypp3587 [Branchiostoma lanceolatum]